MAAEIVTVDPDHWVCSRAEIMDLFPLHWNTHQTRFNGPTFPKEDVVLGNNKYDIKPYINWLINVHYAAINNEEMAREKLRHEKYKADKAMYDAEERVKRLLPRDEVISGLGLLLTGVKNKFLAWIKRLPGLLAGKTAREIEPILEHELYVILSDLAKGIGLIAPREKKPRKIKTTTPKKKGRPKKKG